MTSRVRLGPGAGEHGDSPVDVGHRGGDHLLLLALVQGVELAVRAEDEDAVHAVADEVVEEPSETGKVQVLVGLHRGGDRRNDPVKVHDRGLRWGHASRPSGSGASPGSHARPPWGWKGIVSGVAIIQQWFHSGPRPVREMFEVRPGGPRMRPRTSVLRAKAGRIAVKVIVMDTPSRSRLRGGAAAVHLDRRIPAAGAPGGPIDGRRHGRDRLLREIDPPVVRREMPVVPRCGEGEGRPPIDGPRVAPQRGRQRTGGRPVPPDESRLIRAVRYLDEPKMPPKQKLSAGEIAGARALGGVGGALAIVAGRTRLGGLRADPRPSKLVGVPARPERAASGRRTARPT